jgi:hypothetical protein
LNNFLSAPNSRKKFKLHIQIQCYFYNQTPLCRGGVLRPVTTYPSIHLQIT